MKPFKEYILNEVFDYVDIFTIDKNNKSQYLELIQKLQKNKIDYHEYRSNMGFLVLQVHKKDEKKTKQIVQGLK